VNVQHEHGAATQVTTPEFDVKLDRLPPNVRARIREKIDDMGQRLARFPHFRMTDSPRFRLRIGDHRVIYRFDLTRGEIYLLTLGHRSEIYR
jgi:mRNA-degrading endonuclease RelE of RelBE toxin-antitoxin system